MFSTVRQTYPGALSLKNQTGGKCSTISVAKVEFIHTPAPDSTAAILNTKDTASEVHLSALLLNSMIELKALTIEK